MKMNNMKLLLATCLLLALVLMSTCYVKAIDEEILVEKEVDTTSRTTTTESKPKAVETKETPLASKSETKSETKPNKINRRDLNKELSERRALRNLMREMRNYQFGNDLFDFHPRSTFFDSFLQRPSFFGNSLLGNNFGDMFFNFDRSFEMMRRRMNNMFSRSFLPSLFDDEHQWLEQHLNQRRSIQQVPEQSKGPEQQVSIEKQEQSEQPKKKRNPITSVIKSENQEGKLEYSLDVNNIPRDVFDKKDIEIKVRENYNGDLITIRAEKKTENGHFEFSKSFRFPKGSVDFEQVKASLSAEGTLSVKIPRIDVQPAPERVKSISVE